MWPVCQHTLYIMYYESLLPSGTVGLDYVEVFVLECEM